MGITAGGVVSVLALVCCREQREKSSLLFGMALRTTLYKFT